MSWIPELSLGIWNAWIFMMWLIVLSFLPSFIIKEKKVSKQLNKSPSMRFEKILNITGTALLIASFIYSIFLPLQLNTPWFYIGLFIFLFGFVFLLTVLYTWREANPDRPFTTGPYRYSRHPAYFSFLLIYVSISLMSVSWIFLLLTIIFTIIYLKFIPSEERYCLQTYGKEYQEYMEKTPRWIGLPKSKI
jgi:protein-S-isoprenylcysteine O-methyltransferase Ste14